MLGYTAAEVMNKITPADISDPQEVIARAEELSVELGTPITPGFEVLVFKASRGIEDIYELTYIRKDGSRFPAVVSVTALRDAQDTIIGYLLIGTDNNMRLQLELAEHKKAEDTLAIEKNRLATASRAAKVALWERDIRSNVVEWSDIADSMLGYEAGGLPRTIQTWGELIHPVDRPHVMQMLEKHLEQGTPYDAEYRVRKKDGSYVWWKDSGTCMGNDIGQAFQMSGASIDITERKRAEEEIAWNLAINQTLSSIYIPLVTAGTDIERIANIILEKSRQLTSSAHGFVAEVDPSTGDQIAHTLTRIMKDECKVTEEELRSIRFQRGADGLYNGLWGHALNTREPFYTNVPVKHHASLGIPEGRIAVERFLSVPVLMSGEVVGQIALSNSDRDYTDRDVIAVNRIAEYYALAIQHKRAEEEQARLQDQLRQSQKMEAVGLLAGGIAHDFNNMLMAIVSYGGVLQMKMAEDDPLMPYVDKMLTVVDRAAALTQSLLAFSRKQVINLQPCNLNDIIRKVEKFLARIIGEDIEIQTTFREDPLAVNVDSGQIEQVLMNLATNARDAMPHGGSLSIATESTEIDREFIKAHGYGEPGRYALFSVSDTGAGMDAATIKRIFEPFFTTKELGKGTGLGLAVVYGIVKQHGGYINVYSEPGKGTTFRICLPLLKSDEYAGTEPASRPRPTGGTETILLAEDETELRQLLKDVLTEFNYTVIEAVDGEDAVSKFTGNRERIQLLLLDLIMPKKSGKHACDEIQKMGSDVRTIFISGYPPDVIQGKAMRGLPC